MKPLAAAVAVSLISVSLSACGSASNTGTTTHGGSSAKVVTTSPTKSGAPSAKPFNVGGYLAANVKPKFPVGAPGKVSVVAIGPLKKDGTGSAKTPVAYRNNTSAGISHLELSATARLKGTLVASGESQGGTPAQLEPGEIGFAFIYFQDSKSIPTKGLTYDFSADTMPADTSSYNTAPLTVGEATDNGSSIVGTADNRTGKPLTGPYAVSVYCFSHKKLSGEVDSFADQSNDISAGAQVSFTADLYGTKCAKFAVGVSGYFK